MPDHVRHLLALAVLALVGVTALPAGASGAAQASSAAIERLQTLDQALLARTNQVRADNGLQPLVLSPALSRSAAFHSRSMLEGGFFAHESKDGTPFASRVKRFYSPAGYSLWSAGENLLYGSPTPEAAAAVDAWLNSPPHRRNMLDPDWREVGIASLHADSAGGFFAGGAATVVTMDFGVRKRTAAKLVTAPAKTGRAAASRQ